MYRDIGKLDYVPRPARNVGKLDVRGAFVGSFGIILYRFLPG